MTRDPTPTQMLYEAAHDAIEALSAIRAVLVTRVMHPDLMVAMIDGEIASLEYAIEAHEKEKGL